MYKCSFCHNSYSHKVALHNHKKICGFDKKPIISLRPKKTVEKNSDDLITVIKQMNDKMDRMNQNVSKNINEMNRKIDNINEKSTHTVNNVSTNVSIVNNIITERLPKCFYTALIDKLGKKKAVNLVNLAASKNCPIDIYKELFPSCKMADNPVIFEGNTFKFLSDEGEIVCDDSIIDRIVNNVQTAMLYASSDLIKESLAINKTKQLYELYDIGSIQRNVRKIKLIKKQLIEYIKKQLVA